MGEESAQNINWGSKRKETAAATTTQEDRDNRAAPLQSLKESLTSC